MAEQPSVGPLRTVRRTRLIVDIVWLGDEFDWGSVLGDGLANAGTGPIPVYDYVELEESVVLEPRDA